jgi:hypothetical protein
MYPDEFFGSLGPRRQNDVTDQDVVFCVSHLIAICVDQHLRQVEKFRNQLLSVLKKSNLNEVPICIQKSKHPDKRIFDWTEIDAKSLL